MVLALLLSASRLALAAAEETDGLFPFVLPWDDATPSVTSLAAWNHTPAGRFGHIRVGPDGHFYAGPERIRFLGVNLSFSGNVPTPEEGEKTAARLAKFGVNVVRFHHADTTPWPNGLRAPKSQDTAELAPEAMERLDAFFAALKRHGIYGNLNLLVGRGFKAADGLPAEIEQLDWKDRHIPGFFNAAHLESQKRYARNLLLHRNAKTGLTYAEDPAVAFVEINNEKGLIHSWLGGQVDRLPAVFLADLEKAWNQWLKTRHQTTARLRAAWSAGEQPVGREMLGNGLFARQLEGWSLEKHSGAEAQAALVDDLPPALRAANPAAKAVRLSVAKPGPESWHVQFSCAKLAFEAGKSYTVQFWAKADSARGLSVSASQAHDPWGQLGLSANPKLDKEWRLIRQVFTASQTDNNARIVFGSLGGAGAVVTLAGISVAPGGLLGLPAGQTLENASVARLPKSDFAARTLEVQRDWMRFLQDTEERYWLAMYRYLKDDLKVRAPIAGTIVGCSTPNLMAKLDWVDTHSYWQHPHFPRRPWDSEDWIVNNRTMVNEHGGTLPGLALKRVAGLPHACTEYNHAAPNTYSSEGFLLLAAYAALQDWDAIYVYSYSHAARPDQRQISSFFDVAQHPSKMATFLPAAAMFRRGDVQAARQFIAAELGREKEADLLRQAHSWSLVDAANAGIPREAALLHRVGLVTEGRPLPAGAQKPAADQAPARMESDTGELVWDLSTAKRGLVTVNTPRSKAVIGFAGGQRHVLGDIVIEPGATLQDGWSAITLTALENDAHWLITATGYAENTGMKWKDAAKSSVGRNWGQAPSRVEGIKAKIQFPKARAVEAWALDESGARREKLPVTAAGFEIGPRHRTLWYEVALKAAN